MLGGGGGKDKGEVEWQEKEPSKGAKKDCYTEPLELVTMAAVGKELIPALRPCLESHVLLLCVCRDKTHVWGTAVMSWEVHGTWVFSCVL